LRALLHNVSHGQAHTLTLLSVLVQRWARAAGKVTKFWGNRILLRGSAEKMGPEFALSNTKEGNLSNF
jgi:hypothetical protein